MKKVTLSGYIKVLDSDLNQVRGFLPEHIRLTCLESGCLIFKVDEHETEIGRFDVYEEFESKQAFEAHQDRVQQSDWGKATKRVERFYTIQGLEDDAMVLNSERTEKSDSSIHDPNQKRK